MRTKLLLGVAAALALGISSVMAQTTYSQNVVGYINVTIPAGGFTIMGNQLINGTDANQTNNNINACYANGFVSDPNGPPSGHNTVLYDWVGNGFFPYYYFNAADATTWEGFASPAGWYDALGNYANVSLQQGQAAFVQNASASAMTVTLTGNVFQGTNNATIATGYNMISLVPPVSTNLTVAGYGLPANLTSDPNGPPGGQNDVYYEWVGNGYFPYYWFNAADATTWEGFASPAGWYDALGNPAPLSANPAVNAGFFLQHHGAAIAWQSVFTVQ